jgi:hypothetical protein
VRALVDALAATEYPTLPEAVPLLPLVTVIQLALLVAVHAQPLVVVTVAVADPPATVMPCVSGATE